MLFSTKNLEYRYRSSLSKKTFTTIFLCLASVVFFNRYPQVLQSSNELLENSNFQYGFSHWRVSQYGVEINSVVNQSEEPTEGTSNPPPNLVPKIVVVLSADTPDNGVSINQTLPPVDSGTLLQLSANLKVENVVKGPLDWETARIVLVAYDQSGKPRYDRPHVLASLHGTSGWTQYQRVFQVSPDTASLQVSAQLVHSRGRFLVTGLDLHAVKLNPKFARYRSVFFAAWLALGFWIGWPFVLNRLNTPSNRLVLLATFGILAGVLMPESLKEILGEALWPAAALAPHGDHSEFVQTFNLDFSIPIIDIYKLGHFTMFALLAWAIGAGNRFRPISTSQFFLMSLFATSSEILQLFIPSRGPQLGDIFIDCIGIVFGLAISALCGLLFYRRNTG